MARTALSPIAVMWILVALREHLEAMEMEAKTLHIIGKQNPLSPEIAKISETLLIEIGDLSRTLTRLEELLASHNYVQMHRA